jgi:hypothetical protein
MKSGDAFFVDKQNNNTTWSVLGGEPSDEGLELLADWLLELVELETVAVPVERDAEDAASDQGDEE